MADPLTVDTDHAFNIAHAVANDAEDLRDELARIVRDWDSMSRGWSGQAASAFTSLWDEWHEGAAKVVESLSESSHRLAEAAVRYEERDNQSAEQLSSRAVDMGL